MVCKEPPKSKAKRQNIKQRIEQRVGVTPENIKTLGPAKDTSKQWTHTTHDGSIIAETGSQYGSPEFFSDRGTTRSSMGNSGMNFTPKPWGEPDMMLQAQDEKGNGSRLEGEKQTR